MNPDDIRTLKILEKVAENHTTSQRDLAKALDISLGLVNSFIKRLAKKGYFKITTIPKNRVRYILTAKGVAEKTRLTYAYIVYSYNFYKQARHKFREFFSKLESQGDTRIVFYGAGDLAEIAYLSLKETAMLLVAVVDDNKKGKKFMGKKIQAPAQLDSLNFDRIVITAVNSRQIVLEKILLSGIEKRLVVSLD
jgi:DNA-binding Lrp family transcriptional regulator